jgi:hypothetical protein
VTSRLKAILAPHGRLVQFRGYASIGLGLIPQQKRSDLQLSGVHLVDAPHSGRKEVADKMIIVDAMQFAYTHPEGATLCFITGDVDYAYLLAVLQRPQWKTIVISKGTLSSMLHVNCDCKMRWETDILQLQSRLPVATSSTPSPTLAADDSSSSLEESMPQGVLQVVNHHHLALKNDAEEEASSGGSDTYGPAHQIVQVPGNKDDGEEEDDFELLRTTILYTTDANMGIGPSAIKSAVGSKLRRENPTRFPDRDSVKAFLSRAVETGAVIETGKGPFKVLRLPAATSVKVSKKEADDWTFHPRSEREWRSYHPHRRRASPWSYLPLTAAELWKDDVELLRTVMKRIADETGYTSVRKSFVGVKLRQTNPARFPNREVIRSFFLEAIEKGVVIETGEGPFKELSLPSTWPSRELVSWEMNGNDKQRPALVARVEAMLEMMAENDDVYVAQNVLLKQLHRRYAANHFSNDRSALEDVQRWIKGALQAGKIRVFRKQNVDKPLVCLPRYYEEATAEHPYYQIQTDEQVQHIVNLLRRNGGWLPRTQVIESLKKEFDNMQNRIFRFVVFYRGSADGQFFVAKGAYGQTVALTKQAAFVALELLESELKNKKTGSTKETEPTTEMESPNNLEANAVVQGLTDQIGDKSKSTEANEEDDTTAEDSLTNNTCAS